ncbi:MAG: L-seryl-tRNA(Sec) selenium transferase [Clostridia bacterium]|nr:L-seryl-tRNA(Sec) selenium transferase [Clostridia bacterium]
MNKTLLRALPKVDELLNHESLQSLLEAYPRETIADAIRETIDSLRADILSDKEQILDESFLAMESVMNKIKSKAIKANSYNLRRVINGTGVVIHTNVGRSCLTHSIKDHIGEISCYYSTLEFNIENGKRGSRYSHVESLLCKLTGAEAALVVNNNAAAVMLTLSTMCKDREVIVSRGQLVEIGGSFRVPEVMKQSGAHLVEVGATNKTHLRDYEAAITEETAALLKVHTSNYRILGFTQEIEASELVELSHKYDIPVIEDIGSGSFIDFSKYGLMKEPTVKEAVAAGIDVVTFSGDKMLGGPQAGIIVGKKAYVDAMKKNQLTRALRVDKMTLSALEGTLMHYLDEEKALLEIPTLRMLTMTHVETIERIERLKMAIENKGLKGLRLTLCDDYSEVGGGSLPLEKLPSRVLKVTIEGYSPNQLVDALRTLSVPVIGRIFEDEVVLDSRTLFDEELELVADLLEELLQMNE